MEYSIKEVLDIINVKRDELNSAIEKGLDYNDILKISVELDELIARHNRIKLFNEEVKKYNVFLERPDKDEILKSIREDARSQMLNAPDEDIEFFTNNVYINACLVANGVSTNEIMEIIRLHNNIYEPKNPIVDEPLELNKNTYDELQFCVNIANKYIKIVVQKA